MEHQQLIVNFIFIESLPSFLYHVLSSTNAVPCHSTKGILFFSIPVRQPLSRSS